MAKQEKPTVTVTKDCRIAYRGHTVYELTKGENEVETAEVAADLQARADTHGYNKKSGGGQKNQGKGKNANDDQSGDQTKGKSQENKDAGESPENK